MRAFCDGIQRRIRQSTSTASHCRSDYMTGTGRVVTSFPGCQTEYRQMTANVAADDDEFI